MAAIIAQRFRNVFRAIGQFGLGHAAVTRYA
jgi:hypothetical protein